MATASVHIDDFGPLPVQQPASVAEVGELVRRAAADNRAVYPFGGRTMLHVGLPPTQAGSAVDLRQLEQVIDYPARDMTITVQAGITIARLQEILRKENQQLPVDVPFPEQATLGGALATNASGPRRYGHGTLRDYVIGISVVNDEGQEVKAGGRVVKNVAGYDLCKLYIGSFGTLGIITQVTLKVKPLPEKQAVLTLGLNNDTLGKQLERLHGSRTRPAALCLQTAWDVGHWNVAVGFDGSARTVDWQVQQLREELLPGASIDPPRSGGISPLEELQAFQDEANREGQVSFKATMLPHAVADFCQLALGLAPALRLQAQAGNGVIYGLEPEGINFELFESQLRQLRTFAVASQGNLTVLRCPAAWKQSLPIWGQPRGDAWLMRAVKDKLDPRRLFNPGRFVDGI